MGISETTTTTTGNKNKDDVTVIKKTQPIKKTTNKKRKSKAQIERMKKRAAARGEIYEPPPPPPPPPPPKQQQEEINNNEDDTNNNDMITIKNHTISKSKIIKIAMNLKHELQQVETNESLKAKERRSAKRKAEAIAMEQVTPCFENVTELLEWYDQNNNNNIEGTTNNNNNDNNEQPSNKSTNEKKKSSSSPKNPYICFVGQLSYSTTKQQLLEFIQTELQKNKSNLFDNTCDLITSDNHIQVRLLTQSKPPYKSRGMAFVQVSTPELLYAMLTLHHSMLHGRRINVERTVGGGKNNSRLEKLKQLRQNQATHIQSVVSDIFQQAIDRGEIIPNEIDETAKTICIRHSPRVVQNTLSLYVEKNGKDMDNPSAYFTFLLGKVASGEIQPNGI